MLLARIADASDEVGRTTSRSAKIAILAAVISDLDTSETEAGIGLLLGLPRQGRIGIGWATAAKLAVTPTASSSLEVKDIDQMFQQLASMRGPGSESERRHMLTSVLGRATSIELDFLRRVLIGELRQGAVSGVLTDAVALSAGVPRSLMRRAVMLRGNLGEAALVANVDGKDGLESVAIQVGRAIEPMLAGTAPTPAEALESTGPALVEWKLDGARIQVHKDEDQIRVFTRNLNDVTDRLPSVVEVVSKFDATRLVLDGEVMAFTANGDPQPFQDTIATFGAEHERKDSRPLLPFFFDLMLLDDLDFLDLPLSERRTAMLRIVGNNHIPAIDTDSSDRAENHLASALAAGHEGIMVKSLDSPYEAGRRGKGWRKVKPVHTLDLVVLGAEWGHGRRKGWLSNLHLGARNTDPSGPSFVMVGKTFKGMTDEILAWQTSELLQRTHSAEIEPSAGAMVSVDPDLVVEVAVDGAQASTRYPGGVALRFARIRGYRPDHAPATGTCSTKHGTLMPGHARTDS